MSNKSLYERLGGYNAIAAVAFVESTKANIVKTQLCGNPKVIVNYLAWGSCRIPRYTAQPSPLFAVEISLTVGTIAALFGTMIVLASIPDTSAIAVVARSITSGFSHGLFTVIGILAGDFVFMILAVFSLTIVAESMGNLFVIIKYLGSAYLIWLGFRLWRSNSKNVEVQGIKELSWWSNFVCGLFITLGDPKAILFYMSFLPAFIELPSASILDLSIIMFIAIVAVGGVKLGYAYMADKSRLLIQSPEAKKRINITAGGVMIGTGIFLAVKT